MPRAGRSSGRFALLGFAAWLGALGCAPSQEEIEREFDAYVDGANACSAASDCGIARVDCPLGCFVAVRADRVTSVERKARELIEDYESGGRSCAYDCVEPGALEGVRERCTTAAE